MHLQVIGVYPITGKIQKGGALIMKYMGIDHHKQYFVATVKDEEGTTLRKDRVSTDRAAIRHYFRKVNKR